jgi:hypothetical protein
MVRGMKPALYLSALLLLGCGDGGSVIALHVLPGGSSDTAETDFFAMPFPSDARPKKAGGAPGLFGWDLSRWPEPVGQPGVYVRFLDGRLSAAGPSAAIYFRFSAPLDEKSLPRDAAESLTAQASAYVVDVTPGSPTFGVKAPMLTAFHVEEGQFIGPNWLTLRPVPGIPLRENTTYAAIVTRRVRGAQGEALERHPDLERILGELAPADEPYRAAWGTSAPLRAFLQQRDLANEVVGATLFTTQKATAIMSEIRNAVYAQGPVPAPLDFKYLRDHDGLCSVFSGIFESPNFQDGEPPYLNEGGSIKVDAQGRPVPSRTERLRFALSVPHGEMPADGWPIILYAHGTGGDYQTFIRESLDIRAARIELADGPPVQMAMIGIDQVLHGSRDPSHSDPELTFFNMNNLAAARDNVKQGGADDFQLLRLVENFAIDKAPGTGPLKDRPIKFDKQRIYFVGHSQGGLTGPLFLGAEPKVKAAVLSGAGSVLILSLLHKREPTDIGALVEGLLQETASEDHPLLNLLQAYFESADPNNYGPLLFRRPEAGSPPKSVFQTLGLTDNYTPDPNIAAFALSLGVQPVGPRLYEIPELGLTSQRWGQRPVQNNVADGRATGVLHQYSQAEDSDGHFVIFDLWAARHDWTRFLATHARTGTATFQ